MNGYIRVFFRIVFTLDETRRPDAFSLSVHAIDCDERANGREDEQKARKRRDFRWHFDASAAFGGARRGGARRRETAIERARVSKSLQRATAADAIARINNER